MNYNSAGGKRNGFLGGRGRDHTLNCNRRRGEGVEPSGDNISRQAGFEDRWGHRAPSSSSPYLLGGYGDPHNPQIAESCPWSKPKAERMVEPTEDWNRGDAPGLLGTAKIWSIFI